MIHRPQVQIPLREGDLNAFFFQYVVHAEDDIASYPYPFTEIAGPEEQPEIKGAFAKVLEKNLGLRILDYVRMISQFFLK